MAIFLHNESWTRDEWAIFFANLDVIRFGKGLKKKEFSEKIGVWNIYRKDMKRPDFLTVAKIASLFDVTPEWLCSDHVEPQPYKQEDQVPLGVPKSGAMDKEGLHAQTRQLELAGQKFTISTYDSDPRWIYNAVEEILASDDEEVILALQSNVRVFVDKIRRERNLETRIQKLEKELQREKTTDGGYPTPETKTGDSG